MRRVGKGFSRVETPLFEGMLVEQEVDEERDADENVEEVNAGDADKGDDSAAHREVPTVTEEPSIPSPTPPTLPPQPPQDIPSTSQVQQTPPQSPQHLDFDKVAQALEITKLKRRVKKLERRNKVRVLKLRRLQKVGTSQRVETSDDTVMDDESNQWRKIGRVLSMQEDKIKPVEVEEVVDVVTTAKLIIEVVAAATIDHVKLKAKEDPAVKKYQTMKRKPQTEAQSRKNMMMYLKNVVSFKMDYFKGMSYDDIRPIIEAKFKLNVAFILKIKEQTEEDENRALQKLNETPIERAAKRRKLDEEVDELKRHLQIVPNEDDDVYTEATPLARKVPVVDYQIIQMINKPYYKIIRADDTHQLYISFLTLLRNFDREDLEALWSLVKERFSTTKPNNVFDDFLLVTLGAMFEKPDIHAQIYHNIYIYSADFASGEEVPAHKIYSRLDVECFKVKTAKCQVMLLEQE
nr:hypothetical protein [Tanacetum cinerariifolium]